MTEATRKAVSSTVTGGGRTSMRRAYMAANIPEAMVVQGLLEAEGIPAVLMNLELLGLRGEVPANTYPEVHVSADADPARVQEIIEKYEADRKAYATGSTKALEPWTCAACGEKSEGSFTECWNCGAARADDQG